LHLIWRNRLKEGRGEGAVERRDITEEERTGGRGE
jgi:hypothetical protein